MPANPQPWYVSAFDADYLARYQHRSDQSARDEIELISAQLRLAAGARVLDLCCGAGRHTRALLAAHPEIRITALDLSPALLAAARSETSARAPVCFVRADMRRIPLASGSADAVMNLFTSFGYFDSDDEHQAVFHEVARILKPGARFFFDFFNPIPVLAQLPSETTREINGTTLVEKRYAGPLGSRVCKRIEETSAAGHRVLLESVRAFTAAELSGMLRCAGLNVAAHFGDFTAIPFDQNTSPRCILVAEKPKTSSPGAS